MARTHSEYASSQTVYLIEPESSMEIYLLQIECFPSGIVPVKRRQLAYSESLQAKTNFFQKIESIPCTLQNMLIDTQIILATFTYQENNVMRLLI